MQALNNILAKVEQIMKQINLDRSNLLIARSALDINAYDYNSCSGQLEYLEYIDKDLSELKTLILNEVDTYLSKCEELNIDPLQDIVDTREMNLTPRPEGVDSHNLEQEDITENEHE